VELRDGKEIIGPPEEWLRRGPVYDVRRYLMRRIGRNITQAEMANWVLWNLGEQLRDDAEQEAKIDAQDELIQLIEEIVEEKRPRSRAEILRDRLEDGL
jgi:hypothetical protein